MYKVICQYQNCVNKNIVFYSPQYTEQVLCGGCKTLNSAVEMTQAEFDEVFDYDPFAKSTIGLE